MQLIKLKIHLEQSLVKREISSTPLPLFLGKEIVAGTSLCRAVLLTYLQFQESLMNLNLQPEDQFIGWLCLNFLAGYT